MQPIRILGLTLERVADFRRNPSAKSSGLYAALDRRYGVVGVVNPALSRAEFWLNRLRTFHPDREHWRFRSSLSLFGFDQRTRRAEAGLARWDGQYDLIVQLHTLFAPGREPGRHRYTLHTDNTYLISDRHFPMWAPLRGQQREAWIARERQVYQNAAFLFPRSEFLRRSMIEDYGCDPERVIRVGGGGNFTPAPIEEKRYDGQTALFVGLEYRRKGLHTLLEAWPLVRRKLPDARLQVVGPEVPVKEVPGVEWLGRIDDRQRLAEVYGGATCFVMPSVFEPWGHVFFEAMAFGLPCVGTTVCAMPEIIAEGETGLLAPPSQPEPLAEALVAILGDPARAEGMGRAAHARVAHGYTWDDVVGRMAPYIEQAVAEGAPAARG